MLSHGRMALERAYHEKNSTLELVKESVCSEPLIEDLASMRVNEMSFLPHGW